MVQIISPRKQSPVSLRRRFGERFLSAPALNHRIRRQPRHQNLVPAHHRLPVLLHNLQQPLVEVHLNRRRVLQAVLFGERLDALRLVPSPRHHFIAANVKIRVRKQLRHLSDEAVQKRVRTLLGRVHHAAAASRQRIRPRRRRQFRMPHKPRHTVSRHVELRHHADAPVARKLHDLADLILRIVIPVRPHLVQPRIPFAFDPESLIFRKVPVQHVQLHRRHRFQIALDHLHRHPVPAHVQHQPAPWKSRPVLDMYARDFETRRARLNQLRECRHRVDRALRSRRVDARVCVSDIESVRFVLAQRRIFRSAAAFDRHPPSVRRRRNRGRPHHARLPRHARQKRAHRRRQPRVGSARGLHHEVRVHREVPRRRPHRHRQRHQARRNRARSHRRTRARRQRDHQFRNPFHAHFINSRDSIFASSSSMPYPAPSGSAKWAAFGASAFFSK